MCCHLSHPDQFVVYRGSGKRMARRGAVSRGGHPQWLAGPAPPERRAGRGHPRGGGDDAVGGGGAAHLPAGAAHLWPPPHLRCPVQPPCLGDGVWGSCPCDTMVGWCLTWGQMVLLRITRFAPVQKQMTSSTCARARAHTRHTNIHTFYPGIVPDIVHALSCRACICSRLMCQLVVYKLPSFR